MSLPFACPETLTSELSHVEPRATLSDLLPLNFLSTDLKWNISGWDFYCSYGHHCIRPHDTKDKQVPRKCVKFVFFFFLIHGNLGCCLSLMQPFSLVFCVSSTRGLKSRLLIPVTQEMCMMMICFVLFVVHQ